MKVISFKAEHLPPGEFKNLPLEEIRALEQFPSYTAIQGDVVLASAGIVPQWEGRAVAWSFMHPAARGHMLRIHRAVKRFLDLQDYRRIEMDVDFQFDAGHKWARMLGFTLECGHMPRYFPDGRSGSRYVRLR